MASWHICFGYVVVLIKQDKRCPLGPYLFLTGDRQTQKLGRYDERSDGSTHIGFLQNDSCDTMCPNLVAAIILLIHALGPPRKFPCLS